MSIMKKGNNLGIYEGQGMNIIDPTTHYTCFETHRRAIKAMLRHDYGVEPSDEVLDAFIENEEDWHIMEHLEEDHPLRAQGIKFIDEDRCNDAYDRLNKILEDACMRQEGPNHIGTTVYDDFN